jgi:hypothetical protein
MKVEHFKETQYGFEWGAATIERSCSDKKQGWVCLTVRSKKQSLQIVVLKGGKIKYGEVK